VELLEAKNKQCFHWLVAIQHRLPIKDLFDHPGDSF
jgi:hypothetical protein